MKDEEIRLINSLYQNLPESSFPEKIYKLRKMKDLNREDLAKKVNVHVSTIQGWERGIKTPTRTSIKKICSAFELDISYFEH
jgi:transcriptional regulator with XRE-family HTH domain